MKRSSSSFLLSAAIVAAALAAGCAHVSVGDPSLKPVRVTTNEADVQGCQMISKLRAGAGSQREVRAELENLTRSREGNVLLVSGTEGSEGFAYRCGSGPTEAGGK
jgi:hypothetical protein